MRRNCAAGAALFLRPLRSDLYSALDEPKPEVHILSCDYDMLERVGDGFVDIDRPQYARLTERGCARPAATRCLEVFDDITRRVDGA